MCTLLLTRTSSLHCGAPPCTTRHRLTDCTGTVRAQFVLRDQGDMFVSSSSPFINLLWTWLSVWYQHPDHIRLACQVRSSSDRNNTASTFSSSLFRNGHLPRVYTTLSTSQHIHTSLSAIFQAPGRNTITHGYAFITIAIIGKKGSLAGRTGGRRCLRRLRTAHACTAAPTSARSPNTLLSTWGSPNWLIICIHIQGGLKRRSSEKARATTG